MASRKEILCRRCKTKLGEADHNDFYLVGQKQSFQDRFIVCNVCGWKRPWNFANQPKSRKKKFVELNGRINKVLYGRKLVSEAEREWFEEIKRLDRELERRIEERRAEEKEEEKRLRREEERRREREEEERVEMESGGDV